MRFQLNALVMIVYRDGQSFFRVILADTVQVELPPDFGRLGNGDADTMFSRVRGLFLVEDVFAKNDAVVANVNARAGDELFDFRVRFAAEAAHGDVGRASHLDL